VRHIVFTVEGRPRPQGSKRPFVNQHTGKVALVEQSKHVGDWRARIAYAAGQACEGQFRDVPVSARVDCVFERPRSHYRTGRFSHLLREGVPSHPITRSTGDVDKLARAVLDALTGPVIADDSLVCSLAVERVYGFPERVTIMLGER